MPDDNDDDASIELSDNELKWAMHGDREVEVAAFPVKPCMNTVLYLKHDLTDAISKRSERLQESKSETEVMT
jgi:hypothetical protein